MARGPRATSGTAATTVAVATVVTMYATRPAAASAASGAVRMTTPERTPTSLTFAMGSQPGQTVPQMGRPFLQRCTWRHGKTVGATSHWKLWRHARQFMLLQPPSLMIGARQRGQHFMCMRRAVASNCRCARRSALSRSHWSRCVGTRGSAIAAAAAASSSPPSGSCMHALIGPALASSTSLTCSGRRQTGHHTALPSSCCIAVCVRRHGEHSSWRQRRNVRSRTASAGGGGGARPSGVGAGWSPSASADGRWSASAMPMAVAVAVGLTSAAASAPLALCRQRGATCSALWPRQMTHTRSSS
mmetsp:Transcript_67625/g.185399  ORF Transcript_67625/g.185399 Transcript_67625/m.185399 type:complete len:302 (+) Transcript_67625:1259-2164(+)